MAESPLASFSLTHVHYNPNDLLSLVCAWLALLPQGLCIVYVVMIYTTREVEIGLTFFGQLACEGLNWGLKRWIKEERPAAIRHLGKGYGMPSSHAQFVGYFAASVTLFLLFRHSPSVRVVRVATKRGAVDEGEKSQEVEVNWQVLPQGNSQAEQNVISDAYRLQLHHPRITHALLSFAACASAVLVAWSRTYLSYHTPKQVFVGGAIGVLCAAAWFVVTEWLRRTGWVEWLLEWDIIRKARLRDLVCEEDLVEIGWRVWEEKRRKRNELGLEYQKAGKKA